MGKRLDVDGVRVKVQRRPLHGVLLLDKPLGLSSNEALQKAKWLLRAEKAGHTGTLDPLATGVLPLCFGAATKFSQLHLDADKTYHALAHLGQTTTTGDAEGPIVQSRPVQVRQADLDRVRPQFVGDITQLPPMHSALKKDGRPLYEYARAGIEIERATRQVHITALALELLRDDDGVAVMRLQVCCSKGTYIRTLAQDIGEALGCGAHLTQLRRVATGNFDIDECISLERLASMDEAQRSGCLRPVQSLLADHAVLQLDTPDSVRFLGGVRRRGNWPDAAQVAVYQIAPPALLGTGQVRAGELIAGRLLSPLEVAQMLPAAAVTSTAAEPIFEREP